MKGSPSIEGTPKPCHPLIILDRSHDFEMREPPDSSIEGTPGHLSAFDWLRQIT